MRNINKKLLNILCKFNNFKGKKSNQYLFINIPFIVATIMSLISPFNASENNSITFKPRISKLSYDSEISNDNEKLNSIADKILNESVINKFEKKYLNTSQNEIEVCEVSNNYYDIKCSQEIQDYFFELEEKWDIHAEVAMAIVYKESAGLFCTNGTVSQTEDYGLAQINITNHAYIAQKLGYTTNEIQNDEYKNLDSMYLLLTVIFDKYGYTIDNYDFLNVAGTYNGWTNWQNIESSVEYANSCNDIYNTIFNQEEEKGLLLTKNK